MDETGGTEAFDDSCVMYSNQTCMEGWVLHQDCSNKAWRQCWMVLQGTVLFLFASNKMSSENMIGTLSICSDTEAENEPSRTGFKLRVSACLANGLAETNVFKFPGENERDLWKSFILGISRGFVPSDIELLPKQKDRVHDAIREIWNTSSDFLPWNSVTSSASSSGRAGHDSSGASFHSFSSRQMRLAAPQSEVASHNMRTRDDECEVEDAFEGFQVLNTLEQLRNRQIELSRKELLSEEPGTLDSTGLLAASRSGSTSGGGSSGMFGRGGMESEKKKNPIESGRQGFVSSNTVLQGTIDDAHRCDNNNSQFHLFFADPDLNRHQPEWFVDCTREEAEDLLLRAQKFGNVLMRKSSSFQANGKYVISLRRRDQNGVPSITHYSVIRCKEGFKIEVRNEHSAMHSLSEVMEFFISVAGSGTRPISSPELCTGRRGSLPETPPSPPVLRMPSTPL